MFWVVRLVISLFPPYSITTKLQPVFSPGPCWLPPYSPDVPFGYLKDDKLWSNLLRTQLILTYCVSLESSDAALFFTWMETLLTYLTALTLLYMHMTKTMFLLQWNIWRGWFIHAWILIWITSPTLDNTENDQNWSTMDNMWYAQLYHLRHQQKLNIPKKTLWFLF